MAESISTASHGFYADYLPEGERELFLAAPSDDSLDAEIKLVRSRLASRCPSPPENRDVVRLTTILIRLLQFRQKLNAAPGEADLLAAAEQVLAEYGETS